MRVGSFNRVLIENRKIIFIPIFLLAFCTGFKIPEKNDHKHEVVFEMFDGKIEFKAIGHPSALKILGKGSPCKGTFIWNGKFLIGKAYLKLEALDAGIELRTEHMKSKYLEVEKYSEAQLVLNPVPMVENFEQADFELKDISFSGTLDLHGIKKPVLGLLSIKKSKNEIQIESHFSLRLGDFQIEIPSFAGITLAEEVQVRVLSTIINKGEQRLGERPSGQGSRLDH